MRRMASLPGVASNPTNNVSASTPAPALRMNPKPLAAVLAAALLSACVAPLPYNQRVPKSATYQRLDTQLHAAPAADAAQIEQLQNLVRLTLPERSLFADSAAEPDEAGKALLAQLAPALKGLSAQRVVVKSFTDSVSSGIEPPARFPSTVDLTQARAAAVAAFLSGQGVPAIIVYTSGLGDAHPVASDDTPQGRAKNRRVEIDVVEAPA